MLSLTEAKAFIRLGSPRLKSARHFNLDRLHDAMRRGKRDALAGLPFGTSVIKSRQKHYSEARGYYCAYRIWRKTK